MKIAALLLLILVGLALLALPTSKTPVASLTQTAEAQQQPATSGTIDEIVQQAIASGETHVLYPILVSHEDVEGFDAAKTYYTVVVARALSKQTVQTSAYDIETWYRFAVTETLSTRASRVCANGLCGVPATVSPAGAGEMLLPKSGGSIQKNGVTVTFEWNDFPDFNIGQTYLIFIDQDAANRVGVSPTGPVGVFSVDTYGGLTPVLSKETALRTDIANRFGNNLNQLRNHFNPAPEPTGCDPVQEQNCYNQGGNWNFSTCQCQLSCVGCEPEPDPCISRPWMDCRPMPETYESY
jgi:hypothetical protein